MHTFDLVGLKTYSVDKLLEIQKQVHTELARRGVCIDCGNILCLGSCVLTS